jgi:hypothetical protein
VSVSASRAARTADDEASEFGGAPTSLAGRVDVDDAHARAHTRDDAHADTRDDDDDDADSTSARANRRADVTLMVERASRSQDVHGRPWSGRRGRLIGES